MEAPVDRGASAASAAAAVHAATAAEDSRVRELYNTLRTGDLGVGFEAFLRAFYFLQHRFFSIFDVKEAFIFSTGSNERFLSYRDFQYALTKTARGMHIPSAYTKSTTDAELLTRLLDAIARESIEGEKRHARIDSVRRQLTKPSVLAVLDRYMCQLVQSFQLYGQDNIVDIKNPFNTTSTMSVDGFVDFLNAYFEYEDYFSQQDIEQLARAVRGAFASESTQPEVDHSDNDAIVLLFPHFIELFCRVASQFHIKTLEKEGAQLRKAIESCRLEFSIELLMEKMAISIFRDTGGNAKTRAKAESTRVTEPVGLPGYEADSNDIETLTLDTLDLQDDETNANNGVLHTLESVLSEIRMFFERSSGGDANQQQRSAAKQRVQSVLFSRLPPRKSHPQAKSLSPWHELRREVDPLTGEELVRPFDPPQMTLIREVLTPPALPPNTLKRLEHAITYQNSGQFHMALGALHKCRTLYQEWRGASSHEEIEVRAFFSAMAASVYDSARRDIRALVLYLDALRFSERLPVQHPGRALVMSCMGCMLYYLGEIKLAKTCHERVLAFRRHCPDIGDEHVDTATAMNNLACCLSQDPHGTGIEEAYLYLKAARRVYSERFGPAHPRVLLVSRNFERVLASQRMVVGDPQGALNRGEYTHVIPGSRFQIKALVPVKKEKGAAGGKKKKKKGGKTGKKKK